MLVLEKANELDWFLVHFNYKFVIKILSFNASECIFNRLKTVNEKSTIINFCWPSHSGVADAFSTGDGIGGSEIQIHNTDNKMDCLFACYNKKINEDNTINGATFGILGKTIEK